MPLEKPREWRQCEAEEHRQGQGLQHLGRDRHRADDRQDEEGHDDRMVHRRLALTGHGGSSCAGPVKTQRPRSASPVITPATRPMPKAAITVSVGWWRTRPSALSYRSRIWSLRLMGVSAGGLGRLRDRQ